MSILSIEDFLRLRSSLPVADVRSENEFMAGHIPGASNIPLLKDRERVAVGTDYKWKGKEEAIKTGFRLVGPRLEQLMEDTRRFADGKELLVHCWRGGMRSKNFCGFAEMAGIKTRSLEGGYKAYRQAAAGSFSWPLPFIVIGGKTGTGKSEILRALEKQGEQVIDLEALARHKGSAFGGLMQPTQPTTEQFQNELFEVIRRLDLSRTVWIEDESISIGRIFLPDVFWKRKRDSPVIQVEMDKEIRVDRLVGEYGPANREDFLHSMEKITSRLGGQNFNEAKALLLQGDLHGTISILLNYYDKAYLHSLDKKSSQIVGTVNWDGTDPQGLVAAMKGMAEKARSTVG